MTFFEFFLILWPKSNFQTIVFHLLLYFRNFFFKIYFEQMKEFLFTQRLVITIKNFTGSESSTYFLRKITLPFFHQNQDFKCLFFHFLLYFVDVFFQFLFKTTNLNVFFAHLHVVTRKNNFLWCKHAFFYKIIFDIFSLFDI